MTAGQDRYRLALIEAADAQPLAPLMGRAQASATGPDSEGMVVIEVRRKKILVARACVREDGGLWGAWDPQHLTDNIDVREQP